MKTIRSSASPPVEPARKVVLPTRDQLIQNVERLVRERQPLIELLRRV